MNFMDIYYSVGINLLESDYYRKDINIKKELIDRYLKEYAISKLLELDDSNSNINYYELTLNQLVERLSIIIPTEKHFDTIRHFTHYILNIASGIQNFEIMWIIGEKEQLITNPETNFNIVEKWDNFVTHEKTTYLDAFNHSYNTFQNEFMLKNYIQPLKHLIQ